MGKVNWLILAVVTGFCSFCFGADLDAGKIFPAETVVILEIPDGHGVLERFKQTNFYQMTDDPVMSAFKKDVSGKIQKYLSFGKGNEKIEDWAELLPQGGVTVGLVLNETAKEREEPMLLAVADFGHAGDAAKKKIRELIDKTVEGDVRLTDQEYRSERIWTLSDPSGKRLGGGFSSSLSYCFMGDVLVLSEDVELVKFAMAHIQGAGGETLGSNNVYRTNIRGLDGHDDVRFFLDLRRFITEAGQGDEEFATAMKILGFDGLEGVVAGLKIKASGHVDMSGLAKVKTRGAKQGVLKILDFPDRPVELPGFISGDNYTVSGINFDFAQVYQTVTEMVTQFSPGMAAIFYMPLIPAGPDGDAVELKRDIIDNLGKAIVISSSVRRPFEMRGYEGPEIALTAIELSNSQAFERAFSKLHASFLSSGSESRRGFLGQTIYLIDMAGMAPLLSGLMTPLSEVEVGGQTAFPKTGIAVTDRYLLVGTEEAVTKGLRIMAGGMEDTLSSRDWFRAARRDVPSRTGVYGFTDSATEMELLWWSVKNAETMATPLSFYVMGLEGVLNPDQLPDFEKVKKYFGYSVGYGNSVSDGWEFGFKSINRNE